MIEFSKFTLDNGLRVLVHQDPDTPLAAFNLLYNVGARDEHADRTGFAHLFEHLMFEGSVNVPSYDKPVQLAGGENNAFTTNDLTNYYLTLPAENLETAFWLESDRMLELAFSDEALAVQQKVVIEEYKQRYLNQPYGDVWLLLRPLAYTTHPYRWPTIGREIAHIEDATLDQVKEFFYAFYHPGNAVLSIAGNTDLDAVQELTQRWFGGLPAGQRPVAARPEEPKQTEARRLEVEREVPADALYMAFHGVARQHPDYHTIDLLSDVLSRGKSARLYRQLVLERGLFSELDAFVTGNEEPGLFVVAGKLNPGITIETGEAAVWEVLNALQTEPVQDAEREKVRNKAESSLVFSEMSPMAKALNLATFEWLGDASLINQEVTRYHAVTNEDLSRVAAQLFQPQQASVLVYRAKRS